MRQCVEGELVDGGRIFADSSLVQTDAYNNSVVSRETLDRSFHTATVQNIMVLMRYVKKPKTALGVITPVLYGIHRAYFKLLHYLQIRTATFVLPASHRVSYS